MFYFTCFCAWLIMIKDLSFLKDPSFRFANLGEKVIFASWRVTMYLMISSSVCIGIIQGGILNSRNICITSVMSSIVIIWILFFDERSPYFEDLDCKLPIASNDYDCFKYGLINIITFCSGLMAIFFIWFRKCN